MSPVILIGTGILLFVLGLGCGYWFLQSQRKREAARADDVQKELDDYRRHVTEHFGKTAQHFQALGQQYQSLYKHMAQGADVLCDPAQAGALLEFPTVDAAAATANSEDTEVPPEVIRDYAVEEEVEPEKVVRDYAVADEDIEASHVQPNTEPETASEPDEEVAAPRDEAALDEPIVEQVATEPDAEKERTVH